MIAVVLSMVKTYYLNVISRRWTLWGKLHNRNEDTLFINMRTALERNNIDVEQTLSF